MKRLGIALGILSFVMSFASSAFCQEKPDKVSLCEITRDPAAYNHKLLEVTGLVAHGFEVFNFFDPICPSSPTIWLEYGGKSKSGTTYCCGVTPDRHRLKELVVENITDTAGQRRSVPEIRQVDSTSVSTRQERCDRARDSRGAFLCWARDADSQRDFLGRLRPFGLLQPVRHSTGQVRESRRAQITLTTEPDKSLPGH